MRKLSAVMVFISVLTSAAGVGALDNKRQGFMMGAGLGAAFSSYQVDAVVLTASAPELRELANDNSLAAGIDFRIGGGVNDRVMIFYLSRIPWFDNPISSRGTSVTAGITALAATYAFRDQAGGPYVLGGLGLASWSNGFPLGTPDTWWGFGVIAGAGWEFKPHFPLELTVQWGRPTGEEFGFETSARTVSVIATIGLLLY